VSVRVAFRIDASAALGAGHAMRCLALADALAERGARCSFVAIGPTPELSAIFSGAMHPLCLFNACAEIDPVRDAAEFLAHLPVDTDWVIVDHYQLDARWESMVRPHVRRLLVIDDLADRAHDCDLLLDPGPARIPSDYRQWVSAQTTLLLGPAYALLRPAFRARHACAPSWPQSRRVHVFVGGGGHLHALPMLCNALLDVDPKLIAVAAGSADPGAMSALGTAFPGRIEWQPHVADMAAHMAACSLAVGSPGGATWERACLGLPSALLATSTNQQPVLRTLAALGLCVDLGLVGALSPATLKSALQSFLDDVGRLGEIRERMLRAVDGLGSARVADFIAGASAGVDTGGITEGAVR
jgi:UDP-2,4-diacetamido-2,4,6-trideoxy-beta-L-altropyranose hydrolase